MEGGFAHFPGMARPLVVDSARLPTDAAATLRGLCEAVIAEGTGSATVQASSVEDARSYRLKIDTGSATHELTCVDPIGQNAADLVAFVKTHGSRIA